MSGKNNDKFVIVDAENIQFVKRGRKAHVDPELVDALRGLPVGKAIALVTMKQNPDAVVCERQVSHRIVHPYRVQVRRADRLPHPVVAAGCPSGRSLSGPTLEGEGVPPLAFFR